LFTLYTLLSSNPILVHSRDFQTWRREMKTLRISLYWLGLATLVCMFVPCSASAQDGSPIPCCHTQLIPIIPILDDGGVLGDLYLVDNSDDMLMANPIPNPKTSSFAGSTTTQSTIRNSSAVLPASGASRQPGSSVKSGDVGRNKRSGHGTD
jgi:hypothetical protein